LDQDTNQQGANTLREIRASWRKISSRPAVQREAPRRQNGIALVAALGTFACIEAIGYPALRHFRATARTGRLC